MNKISSTRPSINRDFEVQSSFIQLFLTIGIAGGVLALIDSALIKHSLDMATTLFIGGFIAVCLLTMIITRVFSNTTFARIIINLALFAIILYVMYNTNYGIFWLFIGPVVIILIERFKSAIILLAINIGLILVAQFSHLRPSNFDNQMVLTAVLSMLLISVGLMLYKRKYESINQAVYDQEKQLETMTIQLQNEAQIKDHNQAELTQALSELSQHNKLLSDSREALTNVLEDQKQLEDELKATNAHIEQKVQLKTAQLREEHARLQATVDSLPLGLVILDNDLEQLSCNKIFEQIVDQTVEKKTTHTAPLLLDNFKIKTHIQSCLQRRAAVSLKDIDYEGKVLRMHMAPIVEHRDSLATGVVVVVDDVTEERVMQRSKEEFLSIASHELRTPLTTIRGNASILNKIYQDKLHDPTFSELTEDIALSSERLISIVNDYLETSSLEQGKISIVPEFFAVDKLSEKIIHEFAATAKEKGLYLKLMRQGKGELPPAYADPKRVSQILINLISNALNHTTSGGINVKITTTPDKYLQIFVDDTGSGISQANQKLLFHKFQSADEKILTRESRRSTGLGLYIAKLLTEMMGGEISLAQSQKNHGSSFVFSLPTTKSQLPDA